jgi:tetratricopeptide (TPR) repeat protein
MISNSYVRTILTLVTTLAVALPCAAQDASALGRAGTTAIVDGRFGDALDAFTKAAAARPDDASLAFGAGLAAFMLGRDEEAQARFERALAVNPDFKPAATWLADLHYRAGRLADAIAVLERARDRAPAAPELQEQIDTWRRQLDAQSRFHEVRTEHFATLFEKAADEPLARRVGQRLEVAYGRIGRTLHAHPSERIAVVIYSREQFGDITRLATWSVAAYDGRIRIPMEEALEEPAELDRVLCHELVHALVVRLGGRTVPAWLNEGLATVLEPVKSTDGSAPIGTNGRLPLSKLQRGFVGFSRADAEVAYASAAHAVRRLIAIRGMSQVVALVQDLGRGTPFPAAFSHRIAMRYEDFAALVSRDQAGAGGQ